MRKNDLDRYLEQREDGNEEQEVIGSLEDFLKLLISKDKPREERILNPTQLEFINEKCEVAAYMGAAGAAKTTTLVAGLLAKALLVPDSKILLARHDYNKLMLTTAAVALDMLRNLPSTVVLHKDKSPPMTVTVKTLGDGEPSTITFMGLKDDMGSLQFTDIGVDEADECEEKIVFKLLARKRYVRKGWSKEEHANMNTFRMCYNPPDTTHWLYTGDTGLDFQGKPDPDKKKWIDKVFTPRFRENEQNLEDKYYDKLAAKLPKDLAQRLVLGQYGAVFPGAPVFPQFDNELHGRPELTYTPWRTLFRFWDFGFRWPVCIWAQLDFEGRLLVLRDRTAPNTEATEFAKLIQAETKQYFPEATDVRDYGDPAVNQRKDTGHTLADLHAEGITMFWQSSTIERGVILIRQLLSRLVGKRAAVLFDRGNAGMTLRAIQGGYHLDDKGQKPVKDGFYDHFADAFRYGVLNLFSGGASVTGQVSGIHSGPEGDFESSSSSYSMPANLAYDRGYKG